MTKYQYQLIHLHDAEVTDVIQYWQDLLDRDVLKYRIPEVLHPTLSTVQDMLRRMHNSCFVAVDENRKIVGECMLDNFQGLCAMVHFSIHPHCYGRKGVQIAVESSKQLFKLRRDNSKIPYVQTLLGVTPVSNKLATRFIQKVGFKKVHTLRNAFWLAYNKSYDDGLVTVLESN